MTGLPYVATLITALGCGVVAGVFFAFSTFVMPALRRLPAAHGVAAMQSINVLAVTPVFMTALFGAGADCLGLVVWALIAADDWPVGMVLVGAALYLVGTIGVTIAFNVPMNNRLAGLDPEGPGAPECWDHFVTRWTAWNHVRTVAAIGATAALTIALDL